MKNLNWICSPCFSSVRFFKQSCSGQRRPSFNPYLIRLINVRCAIKDNIAISELDQMRSKDSWFIYVRSYFLVSKSFWRSSSHVSELLLKGDFGPKKLILVQKVDFGPLSKGKYSGPKSPFRSNSYTWLELLQTLFGIKK